MTLINFVILVWSGSKSNSYNLLGFGVAIQWSEYERSASLC